MAIHTENTFEAAIVNNLSAHGWFEGNAHDFDPETALDKKAVLEFIQTSQPREADLLHPPLISYLEIDIF